VIGAFGKGWDDLKTLTDEFVTTAKSKTNASRKVIVSNEQDFFEDFEVTYGSAIPSKSSSFGNEWDLYCAALAEVSARVKRAVENLRSAEALATLVNLRDSKFMEGRKEARDLAWMDLGLFWEHNFGMVNPQTGTEGVEKRIAWQRRLANEIEGYVSALLSNAADTLAGMIEKKGNYPRFYAFNPLSWPRTDVAEVAYAEAGPVHVIDLSTGMEVPSQTVTPQGERRLRILAGDVPSIGYKVYEIQPGRGAGFADAAQVAGDVLENEFNRIMVSGRGAILSLIDKKRGNYEFAKEVNSRFMNDLGPGSGTAVLENAGPVSVTLSCASPSPVAHTSRITLVRDSRRIEICNGINQNFTGTHTWGFGFNLAQPDVWHEEVGAILRAKLLTQGGHYSPRNARYDWLTLNHFSDVTDGAGTLGLTLSNADCYFMKLGNSTTSALDVSTPIISVLAGGRVVNGNNGLPNQGGDSHFLQRFALQTHGRYDQASAMRFALEHQNPFVTRMISGGRGYPESRYSFLSISDPRVLLWALKPAEDGPADTIILRLWNLTSEPLPCTISPQAWSIANAKHVTHIETLIGDADVVGNALQASFSPQQIKTFEVKIKKYA
jgi:alpha-mannosidase